MEFNTEFRKQSLYRLEPPWIDYSKDIDNDFIKCNYQPTHYVIVSAIDQLEEFKKLNIKLAEELMNVMTLPPETYIFVADSDGHTLDFAELPGSFRGSMDHAKALNGLGYEIIRENNNKSAEDIKSKNRFQLIQDQDD